MNGMRTPVVRFRDAKVETRDPAPATPAHPAPKRFARSPLRTAAQRKAYTEKCLQELHVATARLAVQRGVDNRRLKSSRRWCSITAFVVGAATVAVAFVVSRDPFQAAATNSNNLLAWQAHFGWLDVNSTDRFGNTPLHYACEAGADAAVAQLLELGATSTPHNVLHESPLGLCAVTAPRLVPALIPARVGGGMSHTVPPLVPVDVHLLPQGWLALLRSGTASAAHLPMAGLQQAFNALVRDTPPAVLLRRHMATPVLSPSHRGQQWTTVVATLVAMGVEAAQCTARAVPATAGSPGAAAAAGATPATGGASPATTGHANGGSRSAPAGLGPKAAAGVGPSVVVDTGACEGLVVLARAGLSTVTPAVGTVDVTGDVAADSVPLDVVDMYGSHWPVLPALLKAAASYAVLAPLLQLVMSLPADQLAPLGLGCPADMPGATPSLPEASCLHAAQDRESMEWLLREVGCSAETHVRLGEAHPVWVQALHDAAPGRDGVDRAQAVQAVATQTGYAVSSSDAMLLRRRWLMHKPARMLSPGSISAVSAALLAWMTHHGTPAAGFAVMHAASVHTVTTAADAVAAAGASLPGPSSASPLAWVWSPDVLGDDGALLSVQSGALQLVVVASIPHPPPELRLVVGVGRVCSCDGPAQPVGTGSPSAGACTPVVVPVPASPTSATWWQPAPAFDVPWTSSWFVTVCGGPYVAARVLLAVRYGME